jgi:lipopolysaccharide transport system ATP-binding protein
MTSAIKIENLSKKYIIRHEELQPYVALRDVVMDKAKRIISAMKHPLRGNDKIDSGYEEFWALSNISLNIQQGERVGIIGSNGAGKSTLLKILSRITEPTKGSIRIRGRVASLLEVGTGFHPELTGRENIYLNGAILGMSKQEIQRNFDAIVDFSGVEKFLDTPVKRYSSGMYVRLAFSVAAHLESDILIVDEVLAVGDAQFQKKCMARMEDISEGGRTILFVSHNMGAVAELCSRAVFLHQGRKMLDGIPSEVIKTYISQLGGGGVVVSGGQNFPIFVTQINLYDSSGILSGSINLGMDATLEIKYSINEPLTNVTMSMILERNGTPLLYSYDTDLADTSLDYVRKTGEYTARINLPLSKFKEGQYVIRAKIGVGQTNMTNENSVLTFEISNFSINTQHRSYREDRPGHLHWPLKWDTRKP